MRVNKYIRNRLLTKLLHYLYMLGINDYIPHRLLRRLFARSELHRAWLSGKLKRWYDDYGQHGVCGYFNHGTQCLKPYPFMIED